MVEKVIRRAQNVIDFASFRQGRCTAVMVQVMPVRICCHCGAALADGEVESECSSVLNAQESLRWQAAQILRGLI
jgi:predicted nucleic acid-binding Zn ribbon protein